MVEHQIRLEQSSAAAAVVSNPLHEQYVSSMTIGGGGDVVQAPANLPIMGADGTFSIPNLTTGAAQPEIASPVTTTKPATAQPTEVNSSITASSAAAADLPATPAGNTNNQVKNEYNATMGLVQNPTGTDAQLEQVLQQFGAPSQSSPTYQQWAAGYSAQQIKEAYESALLAAGPQLPLWAYLSPTMPGCRQAVEYATEAYNQQIQSQFANQGGDQSGNQSGDNGNANQSDVAASDPGAASDTLATAGSGPANTDQAEPAASSSFRSPDPGAQLGLSSYRSSLIGRSAPSDIDSLNSNFVTQYRSERNLYAPTSDADCGPTSVLMAFKTLGVEPQGQHPEDAEREISIVREMMTRANDHTQYTDVLGIHQAAQTKGIRAVDVKGLDGIDQALANHGVVVSAGNPGPAWANRLGNAYPKGPDGKGWGGPHFVTVLGNTNDGGYWVADPLSKAGVIAVSGAEMQTFINGAYSPGSTTPLRGGVAMFNTQSTPTYQTA